MSKRLAAFAGYGLEFEYMLVDPTTLKLKPICDLVLAKLNGAPTFEWEDGAIAWSNELARHVIEVKTNGPTSNLTKAREDVHAGVLRMNTFLKQEFAATLLPTAMHPFMNPDSDTELTPSDNTEIYDAYDRIFKCQGHGWSNLQSVHINLPFQDDAEFSRLHSAVRIVLPLIAPVAASSPIVEGRRTASLDNRLEYYRYNQNKIPSITGSVIPEAVHSEAEYQRVILEPIYKDLEKYDARSVLGFEWVNSRGAIAKFERNAVEIRLVDSQECVRADFAIVAYVSHLVRALYDGHFAARNVLADFPSATLISCFEQSLDPNFARIDLHQSYLHVFGIQQQIGFKDLWAELFLRLNKLYGSELEPFSKDFSFILEQGCLAQRIIKALGSNTSAPAISEIYKNLAHCLKANQLFA